MSSASDSAEPPRLRRSRLRSAQPRAVPVHITIEWTTSTRRLDAALDRRRLHTVMRRAVRETLATAPPQHEALTKYFVPSKPHSLRACEIGITICSDAEIAELNGQYRDKPRPTDVLSFAQSEGEIPFDFPLDETPDAPPRPLGDLVISIETTLRQAREQKHSLETEITFLTVHGTLHLLGYDHVSPAGRRAMWKWQDAIVARCELSGDKVGHSIR